MTENQEVVENLLCEGFGIPLTKKSPIRLNEGRGVLPILFNDLGFNKGAEIGVYKGEFSRVLLGCNPELTLISVDPYDTCDPDIDGWVYPNHYEEAKANLAQFGERSIFMLTTSYLAAEEIPNESLDFVFIDGNHKEPYAFSDIQRWSAKVRSGGIVSLHDFFTSRYNKNIGVKKAAKRYLVEHPEINRVFVLKGDKRSAAFWVKP